MDNDTFVLYAFKGESLSYLLMVTDGIDVFREELPAEDIENRNRTTNPAIEITTQELIATLSELLSTSDSKTNFTRASDDNAVVHAQGKIAGFNFEWRFALRKTPSREMFDSLTLDLLKGVAQLLRRQEYLCKVIKEKELEIFEYEQSGAVLERKSCKTKVFSPDDLSRIPLAVGEDDGHALEVLATREFKSLLKSSNAEPLPVNSSTQSVEEVRSRRRRMKLHGPQKPELLETDEDESSADQPSVSPRKQSRPKPMKRQESEAKKIVKKLKGL